jgi:hypothetical protein
MVLEEVKSSAGSVCGISVSFEEDLFIDTDTMGKWLAQIIKKAK